MERIANISSDVYTLAEKCIKNNAIDLDLYSKYDVKRGLRDINGNGVLTGLTEISEIKASEIVDGRKVPCDGKLYYRGYDIEELIKGLNGRRFGFEEITYLLLFDELATQDELNNFIGLLSQYRELPTSFVRDIILKAPSNDMMNTLARSVLTLYAYDKKANDTSVPNVLRQCLQLIALFPLCSVYGYQAYNHYFGGNSLFIHKPVPEFSTAENILHCLRSDGKFEDIEARILDISLILHAEHGGGNNSTFTTHVVTSSGTDTYSVIAASLGSLKGPKHGGANIKVVEMFENIKENISDWNDSNEVKDYLAKILDGEVFDKQGLIYGMGHAVYSKSDPRAKVFSSFVERLAEAKGKDKEYKLYSCVEKLAPEIIAEKRKIYKGVSANVDFYSGFVYKMLDLPTELFTPLFAIARISGWSAHRLEEIINAGKIIRPAYKSVREHRDYVDLCSR